MKLPVPVDLAPMEAETAARIPRGDGWSYEPKWDGFRCLVFRDGDEVELRSKAGKPLARYFPDVVEAMRALPAKRFVLDGEIVVPVDGALSFDDLLQRIHPAASRVQKLAAANPAWFVAFDALLGTRGGPLLERPLRERRAKLEEMAGRLFGEGGRVALSPATGKADEAEGWLGKVAGLDGVVAKRLDDPYLPGERAMVKVKNLRSADCVVGGFRYAAKGGVMGSLLLGLFGDDGLLHHVGFCSAFKAADKEELTRMLEAHRGTPGFTGRAPGGPSRWSTERTGEWEPLRTELVVEVQYDHFSGNRFRHGTRFLRWRPDKDPRQCLMSQVAKESRSSLGLLG